ncbi:MAG: amino acid ABC transporter permease [Actinomycetota bacterium]
MAGSSVAEVQGAAIWRNVRFLRVVGQIVFAALVLWAFRELYLNLEFGVHRVGTDLSFDFLQTRSGIPIKEGIAYDPNQSYLRAYVVAVVNTLRVAGIGVVLAMLLGLVMGVARLSGNWLVRKIAQVYVEVIRNTPVLIQIIFWYFGILFALPLIEGGLSLGGVAFLSQRGAVIPWPHIGEGAGAWGLWLLGGLALAGAVWWWRTNVNERTGRPHHRVLWSLPVLVTVAAVGYAIVGDAVRLDVPEVAGRLYRGGFQLSGEFTGILVGLVIYTAAFIAEIVRGSILAVDRGQKEAAQALGLSPAQQLRFVVLPQAFRIALPPLNSQFLNLTKNSSLAVAVAYPELSSVSSTMINQAGRPFQITMLVMATYLTMSLTISFVMNVVNRVVTRKGERR